MLVCFPKFLNLGLSLTNPGNLNIRSNTTFTINARNPFTIDIDWSYTELNGISVVKTTPKYIIFKCNNILSNEAFTVTATRQLFTPTVSFQLTCVNTPANFQYLSMTTSNITFNWTGGLNDNL